MYIKVKHHIEVSVANESDQLQPYLTPMIHYICIALCGLKSELDKYKYSNRNAIKTSTLNPANPCYLISLVFQNNHRRNHL